MSHIRIHNATADELGVVRVYLPKSRNDGIECGPLGRVSYSEYRQVPAAYRIARIEANDPHGEFSLQPYDYVGEEPLAEGHYTYHLGIEQNRLTLRVEAEPANDV